MGKVQIGTSGFNYKDWKKRFYPEGLPERKWLAYYAQHFHTVEINASFYHPMSKATYTNWYEQTGPEFQFAIKGNRSVTQLKKLHEVDDEVKAFFEQASGLKEKLAVVLWQFPPSFKLSSERADEFKDRLKHFLTLLPSDVRQAFEFRDDSWFTDDVKAILDNHHAAFTISESSKFPTNEIVGDEFVYIRFHGPKALYASKYTPDQIKDWAHKIRSFAKDHDVYGYFNNDLSGFAIQNARDLESAVEGREVKPVS